MRVLREDPDTFETTYITATIAFRRGQRPERHPIVQEFFPVIRGIGRCPRCNAGGSLLLPPGHGKARPLDLPRGRLFYFVV